MSATARSATAGTIVRKVLASATPALPSIQEARPGRMRYRVTWEGLRPQPDGFSYKAEIGNRYPPRLEPTGHDGSDPRRPGCRGRLAAWTNRSGATPWRSSPPATAARSGGASRRGSAVLGKRSIRTPEIGPGVFDRSRLLQSLRAAAFFGNRRSRAVR